MEVTMNATDFVAGFALLSIGCALVGRGLVTRRRETLRTCLLFAARMFLGTSLFVSLVITTEAIHFMQGGGSLILAEQLVPLFLHSVPVQIVAVAVATSLSPRALFTTASLLVLLAGGTLFFMDVSSLHFVSGCDHTSYIIMRDKVLEESTLALQGARIGVVTLGVLALAQSLWAAKRPAAQRQSSTRVPVAVFAVGVVAFVLTRAHAKDADSPLPFLPGAHESSPGFQTPPGRINAEGLRSDELFLRLRSDEAGGGASFDEENIDGTEDFGFAVGVTFMSCSWGHEVPLRPIVVLADASMSRAEIQPWLDVLRAHHVPILAGSWSGQVHHSETLGPIERGRMSAWPIDPLPGSPGATWGELAHHTAVPRW